MTTAEGYYRDPNGKYVGRLWNGRRQAWTRWVVSHGWLGWREKVDRRFRAPTSEPTAESFISKYPPSTFRAPWDRLASNEQPSNIDHMYVIEEAARNRADLAHGAPESPVSTQLPGLGAYMNEAWVSSEQAILWRASGFQPSEAATYHKTGIDVDTAKRWRAHRFSARAATAWSWIDPASARHWVKVFGNDPHGASTWHGAGFDADEAAAWKRAGILNAQQALRAREARISPADADEFRVSDAAARNPPPRREAPHPTPEADKPRDDGYDWWSGGKV